FQAGYLKSIAAHQAVKTRLVENIATAYYGLVALDAQLKILNETVETREKTGSTIQALKDAGQVTQVAVDQNVAQYNNAKALEIEVKTEIVKLENTWSILLAKQPQHFERSTLDDQAITTGMKVGVPYVSLRNRADVIADVSDFIRAIELNNVAATSFYPSLTLREAGRFQSLEFQDWFTPVALFGNLV